MMQAPDRSRSAEATEASSLPLGQMLSNSASELLRLVQMMRDIEAGIFDAAHKGGPAAEAGASLHYLDFVIQTLDELAAVFRRLAEAAPEAAAVDHARILGPVRLALLKHALAQSAYLPGARHPVQGENIELF